MNVLFVVEGASQEVRGTGITRNISRGGMYFEPRHWRHRNSIRKGDTLRMRLGGISREGRVLRVDRQGGPDEASPGIAVRFHGSPDAEAGRVAAG